MLAKYVPMEVLFVLTDDCFFAHATPKGNHFDESYARERVALLDQAMPLHGVQRRPEKDATAVDCMTGMGCCLTGSPPRATPDPRSILRCVQAAWELDLEDEATPGSIASLLGTCQWFCLLCRPFFSIFKATYAFARSEPLDRPAPLPRKVTNELQLFGCFAPLLIAELAKDYVPLITASDATPDFGFGVSVAPADQPLLRSLGRLSERRSDFVRLERFGDFNVEAEKPRLGNPFTLGVRKCDFTDILFVRARKIEHSGTLELEGVMLLLKWVCRHPEFHEKRLLTLVDAKAILGALQKGRSSSGRLGCEGKAAEACIVMSMHGPPPPEFLNPAEYCHLVRGNPLSAAPRIFESRRVLPPRARKFVECAPPNF